MTHRYAFSPYEQMDLSLTGELPDGGGPGRTRTPAAQHVMLVQPRGIELRAMAEMLDALGYRVTRVSQSGKALLYFGRELSDIVISELDLPQLNGYQLAHHIKNFQPHTRILLTTARCQAEVVDYMQTHVVDGWLFKPFRLNVLGDMLKSLGRLQKEVSWTI
jgi:CheY-like chemotaxis protein